MAGTYANSECTLATMDFPNADSGMFYTRAPFIYDPFRSIKRNGSIARTAVLSPLRSRAWGFQERLLSRRMLYMTRLGMEWEWECNECIADEYNQPGILYRSALEPVRSSERLEKSAGTRV